MTDEMVRWCLNAVYGGLAGGTARMAVHPFDTVKRRMQAHVFVAARPDKYGRIPHFTSFWGCFHHIIEHEGACVRAHVGQCCAFLACTHHPAFCRSPCRLSPFSLRYWPHTTSTGVAALYKGLVPTLLKSVFSTAIIFSFYEGLKGKL